MPTTKTKSAGKSKAGVSKIARSATSRRKGKKK
jgi:hypothetical protein